MRKLSGLVRTLDKAHVWIAGELSKNTWFTDSCSVPHLSHYISYFIPQLFKFFITDKHLEIIYHRKCFNFERHFIFHDYARSVLVFWTNNGICLSLSIRINLLYCIFKFGQVSTRLSKMSSISIYSLILTQWDAFNNHCISQINQVSIYDVGLMSLSTVNEW